MHWLHRLKYGRCPYLSPAQQRSWSGQTVSALVSLSCVEDNKSLCYRNLLNTLNFLNKSMDEIIFQEQCPEKRLCYRFNQSFDWKQMPVSAIRRIVAD